MQDSGEDNYLCPSFNNFGYISEIAAKISDECKAEEEEHDSLHGGDGQEDEDFEFYPDFSVSTVEFIYEGQNKFQPIFPVFNRDLLINNVNSAAKACSNGGELSEASKDFFINRYETSKSSTNDKNKVDVDNSIRIPLKNLFLDERELELTSSSETSESEVDDLDTIPPGTYCVWKPKMNDASSSSSSPSKCKKSKSTGSVSKKWKIRDLLRRSNSDGKHNSSFVFLTPKKGTKTEEKDSGAAVKVAGKMKQSPSPAAVAHQALYVRNRTGYEVDKNRKKSYLPYRQDLIGVFASVNGLSRTFHPFST